MIVGWGAGATAEPVKKGTERANCWVMKSASLFSETRAMPLRTEDERGVG